MVAVLSISPSSTTLIRDAGSPKADRKAGGPGRENGLGRGRVRYKHRREFSSSLGYQVCLAAGGGFNWLSGSVGCDDSIVSYPPDPRASVESVSKTRDDFAILAPLR